MTAVTTSPEPRRSTEVPRWAIALTASAAVALYRVDDHGLVRPDSWADQYRRNLDLFDRWLVPK